MFRTMRTGSEGSTCPVMAFITQRSRNPRAPYFRSTNTLLHAPPIPDFVVVWLIGNSIHGGVSRRPCQAWPAPHLCSVSTNKHPISHRIFRSESSAHLHPPPLEPPQQLNPTATRLHRTYIHTKSKKPLWINPGSKNCTIGHTERHTCSR
jgi:hypothetical protein